MDEAVDEVVRKASIVTAKAIDRKRLLRRAGESAFMGLAFYFAQGPVRALAASPQGLVGDCDDSPGCGCPPHCGPSPCCVAGCSSLCSCNGTTCAGGCSADDGAHRTSNCWTCVDNQTCRTYICCDCTPGSGRCICAQVLNGCSPVEAKVVWENGAPVNPGRPLIPTGTS